MYLPKSFLRAVAFSLLSGALTAAFAGTSQPAEKALQNYLAAESEGVSHFEFCKKTRPYVLMPAARDPEWDCPPHSGADIVLSDRTKYSCKAEKDGYQCEVTYSVVGTGLPGSSAPWRVDRVQKSPTTQRIKVNLVNQGGWKVEDPYISPHISAAALLRAIERELAAASHPAERSMLNKSKTMLMTAGVK
ncbi:hypothetical protein AACH10_02885 [Ideonella sp. DXS22W]|uniref:DUF3828 domain-containing protein n=1 Tax=Pseudaquabacterium inlustre TaxID=2984192 RepID=A0ABU9CDA3_9BURK